MRAVWVPSALSMGAQQFPRGKLRHDPPDAWHVLHTIYGAQGWLCLVSQVLRAALEHPSLLLGGTVWVPGTVSLLLVPCPHLTLQKHKRVGSPPGCGAARGAAQKPQE